MEGWEIKKAKRRLFDVFALFPKRRLFHGGKMLLKPKG
jgi:hypothetical protein